MAQPQPRTQLFLFGLPRLLHEGQPLALDRRKAMALLTYLAVKGQTHSRDWLAALFWPESEQRKARAALRQALFALGAVLGEGYLQVERETVSLDGNCLWVDVNIFLATSTPTSELMALYQADFMAGFGLPDCPEFDRWQAEMSEQLRQHWHTLNDTLMQQLMEAGDIAQAIGTGQRWLATDPTHEPAHRALMLAYALAGQPQAAQQQYQRCAETLRVELGVPPADETVQLLARIAQGKIRPSPKMSAAASTSLLPSAPIHLPHFETSFVGRTDEREYICQQLLNEPQCRLLTLVGPGGMGKTRLSIEAARVCSEHGAFADGVFFIALEGVDSPAHISEALGHALGFTFYQPSNMRQQLVGFLRNKAMLLVLDNFEHLLADGDRRASEVLAEMLRYASTIKLLVTCRERLHLQSEWILDIDGLDYPPANEAVEPSRLADYSAVQLFAQRVRQIQPRFDLQREAAPVLRVCQLVNGMPLALEMAAAWARVLRPAAIVKQIERNLDFLSSRMVDVPERHRSVRAIFDQTWAFLSGDERQLLCKLAIFRGGFTYEAVEQIVGVSLSQLSGLCDRALLRTDSGGRFVQHDLLRQYALEQLQMQPTMAQDIRSAHAHYFSDWLHAQSLAFHGPRETLALQRIGSEIDNSRGAWQWSVAQGEAVLLAQAVDALFTFYMQRSWLSEADEIFQSALKAPTICGTSAQMKLLIRAGYIHMRRSRHDRASAALEAGLQLAQAQQSREEETRALNYLGSLARMRAQFELGERRHVEALAIAQGLGHHALEMSTLNNLGVLAQAQGDYSVAQQHYTQALALAERLMDEWHIGLLHNNLGVVCSLRGEREQAQRHHGHSLAVWDSLGDRDQMARTLNNMGILAFGAGKHEEAAALYRRAIEIRHDIGDEQGMALCEGNLANVLRAQGDYAGAMTLRERTLAFAQQLGDRAGIATALIGLAEISQSQQDWPAMQLRLRDALRVGAEAQIAPLVLYACGMAALWLRNTDRLEGAEALASQVLIHAACPSEMRQQLGRDFVGLLGIEPTAFPKPMSIALLAAEGMRVIGNSA